MMKMEYKLIDPTSNKTVACTVDFSDGKVWLQLDGYGDCCSEDGFGFPVGIEYYDGRVRVIVWGDINLADPTAQLTLEGARESKRSPE
jgi:hypothetical protein